MSGAKIQFVDLHAQRDRIRKHVDERMTKVVEHGQFILGPEVRELEETLASMTGATDVVSCASGTDALVLALFAHGVGAGDAVLVPSFTFVATAEAVVLAGATPVFVDVHPDSFNIDVASVATGIARARDLSLRPAGVIAVDLFGLPADYAALNELADAEGLWVIADAAQSVGGWLDDTAVGALAPITATSFFPSKPLGCYGDGGAVFVADPELAAVMRSLRVHGQGVDKYDNVRIGMNARLDTIQAAVLLAKLEVFEDELRARDQVADRYRAALEGAVDAPSVTKGARSAWAQYTIRTAGRDDLAAALADAAIPTQVYYRRPLHQQPAYVHYPSVPCPASERLADEVLSLPMHPYLREDEVARIGDVVRRWAGVP